MSDNEDEQNDFIKNKINPLKCEGCKVSVYKVKNNIEVEHKVVTTVSNIVINLCDNIFKLFPDYICEGTINEQAPIWIKALWDHQLNPNIFCANIKYCHPKYENIDIDALIQDIIKDKPKKEKLIPKQKETFKFLHIGDLHTDKAYEVGANSDCPYYTCCRKRSGEPKSEEAKAGYWGSIGICDIPQRTFNQFANFVAKYIKKTVDFAIWVGDNTSHNVWAQSREENKENTKYMTDYFKKVMPDFQMYPIFGNHESFPVNIYNFQDKDIKDFNGYFADLWNNWLDKDSQEQLRQTGSYEVVLGKEYNNLKIITLNTGSCDELNFSLTYNPTDPGNYLQKLRESLYESEKIDQPVYIMAHIPNNSGCRNTWARVFAAIVDRFSYTIRGIFNGHTHNDSYGLFYDHKTGEPVNANFISPSLTTFSWLQPSFRVIEADKETMQVLNIYQYRLDLEYWNQFTSDRVELFWERAYDFLSEYKLENMWDPQNLHNLRKQIGSDLEVYNKYRNNFQTGIHTFEPYINKFYYCQILPSLKDQAECMGKKYTPNFQEWVAGPWFEKIKNKNNGNNNN